MNISAKSNTKIFLILDAIILSLIAQQFLIRDKFLPSIILFLIAIGSVIFAVNPQTLFTKKMQENLPQTVMFISRLRWIFAGWALLLAGFTFFLFESSIPPLIVWMIHCLSIGLFLIAVFDINLPSKMEIKQWLGENIPSRLILLFIILLGCFFRFNQVDVIPFGTWYDEADFGLNALSILGNPKILPVFFESSRVPAYFIYLCALSIKLFGATTTSLRFVSAFFGCLTILLAYLFGKELLNPKSGLVFAALISFSRWHINWSRIGLDNITVPFFEILVLLLLLISFRKQKKGYFALAGISFGLGLSFYASMRIFPAVIGLWLILKWVREKGFIRKYWQFGVIFVLAALITMVPISQYAVFHPDRFWDRVKQTSIFEGKTNEEAWAAIKETSQEHLLMFNYRGDNNGRHNLPGEPMLDPISAALMVLGLGICLSRINKPNYFLLIVWWLIMLTPGIFSLDFESPQSLRAIGSLPAAYLLALIPLDELLYHAKKMSKRWLTFAVHSFVILGLMGICFYNINFYFNRQMQSSAVWLEFSASETIVAKEMNRIGPANYYVSTFFYNTPTLRFLAPQVRDYHRLETYDLIPLSTENDLDYVFFVDVEREPFYKLYQQYFPNAKLKKIYAPNGILILYEMQISVEDIKTYQGLTASYIPENDENLQPYLVQKETDFSFAWADHISFPQPYQVVWEGVLYIEDFGDTLFSTTQPENTQLWIDQSLIPWNHAVLLAKGNHQIKIQTKPGEGTFSITWQQPEKEPQLLTAANLFTSPISTHGLLGEYTSGTDWSGPVKYAQIDPYINFYYHNQPVARPYTVRWQGRIDINTEGVYQFILNSRDGSQLFIDDFLVVDNDPAGKQTSGEVNLESGFHSIRITYTDASGYSHISLFWIPPGGEEILVPTEALFYP